MCKSNYFFKPRVIEKTYQQGFCGYRTLIVGASLPCYPGYYNCDIWEDCQKDSSLCDKKCPPYTKFEDKEYYCLSNSNEIEIQSYIEGSSHSHLFERIYKFMGKGESEEDKMFFWNQVAFINYHQNIYVAPWNYINLPAYVEDTEKNYKAFLDVLDELNPEIIYIYKSVRDIIKDKHIDGLEEIDCLFSENTIEKLGLYPFIYKITSKEKFENIIQEFRVYFPDVSFLEETILHALFKARRHDNELNNGIECSYAIKGEMISFVEKHAWDKKLYQYLVNRIEKKSGLSEAVEYIKKKMIKNEMKVASTFGINDEGCFPISGYSHSELSFFSFKKHKTSQELNVFDLLLYYFDEYTEKKEVKRALTESENEGQRVGIVIKLENFLHENELLNSDRIREIHYINKNFIFISIESIAPFCQIKLVDECRKFSKTVSLEYLKTQNGNKLNFENYIKEFKLIEKYKELLDKLENKGWIKKVSGIYNIIPKKFIIKYEIITPRSVIEKERSIPKKTSKGAVYTWFKYKGISDVDIINLLHISDDSSIRKYRNEYKKIVKAIIETKEGPNYKGVLDKRAYEYFNEILEK